MTTRIDVTFTGPLPRRHGRHRRENVPGGTAVWPSRDADALPLVADPTRYPYTLADLTRVHDRLLEL